jgi:hypothetical protein
MDAIEKINRARRRDKEVRVRQETHKANQFRLMPFRVFLAKRNKLGFGQKTRATKAISEEIDGSFDDQAIVDAIYCYMSANADADEKWVVADELAQKIIAMSQSANVILLAASIHSG